MADDNKNNTQMFDNAAKVTQACEISIDNIIKALHDKAVSTVKTARIQNSALDDDKFQGAGTHMIIALPKDGNEIERSVAIESLNQYISIFSGPDIKVDDNKIWPIEDESHEAPKTKKTSTTETKAESIIDVPTFSMFLNEEAEDAAPENDAKKAEQVQQEESAKNERAKGFYTTFNIKIEGQKEKPLSDALKGFAKNVLKDIGVSFSHWRTGATDGSITIGDMASEFEKVFGSIEPEELRSRFTKNVTAKFPQTVARDVDFYNNKTIALMLKDKLSSSDKKKLQTAEYSLCYKVNHDEKSRKLMNPTVVADTITRSIKGLVKKFSNKVTADNVIFINSYDETRKDKDKQSKALKTKRKDNDNLVVSSMTASNRSIILEKDDSADDIVKRIETVKNKFIEFAKSSLGDSYKDADIRKGKEIMSDFKAAKITESDYPKAFNLLSTNKDKNMYILTTTIEKLSESMTSTSIMKLLFEEVGHTFEDVKTAVIEVFKKLFDEFQHTAKDPSAIAEPSPLSIQKDTTTESLRCLQVFDGIIIEASDADSSDAKDNSSNDASSTEDDNEEKEKPDSKKSSSIVYWIQSDNDEIVNAHADKSTLTKTLRFVGPSDSKTDSPNEDCKDKNKRKTIEEVDITYDAAGKLQGDIPNVENAKVKNYEFKKWTLMKGMTLDDIKTMPKIDAFVKHDTWIVYPNYTAIENTETASVDHGHYDFYIVPMPKLKFKTTDDDDSQSGNKTK